MTTAGDIWMEPSPADISYAAYLAEDEKAKQRAIVRARRYYDGRHPVYLTDRAREFIGIDQAANETPFCLNLTRLIIKAVVERLHVSGFTTTEPEQVIQDAMPDGTPVTRTVRPVAQWAWELWQNARMDAKAVEVHKMAIRDGRSFVLIEPDFTTRRACFYPHPYYTDPECDSASGYIGDGYGMKVFYPDDDPCLPPLYATKRWTATAIDDKGRRTTNQMLNIYYPDRIEHKILKGGEWQDYTVPETATQPAIPAVQPWLAADKTPLGIPVIEFCNEDERSEAADAIGLNDAVNKSLVDLIAAADSTGFRIIFTYGFAPPTTDGLAPAEDGSNAGPVQPGMIISTQRRAEEVGTDVVEGADLESLNATIQNLITWTAMTTDTPLSRFVVTKQIAGEGTLKQQEGPLLGKVEHLQVTFGDAWEDCMSIARRIENTFFDADIAEDVQLSTEWRPAATRDDKAEAETAKLHKDVGVPVRFLWSKLGYSEDEIAEMEVVAQQEAQRAFEQQQMLLQARDTPPPPQGGA